MTAQIRTLNREQVLSLLPNRSPAAHKGDFGKLLLLCGSRGFTGAAVLAAMGALRCGAGLVFLGVPACIYAIEAVKLTEPVVFPLPGRDGGYSEAAVPEVRRRMAGMDAVLIGCGMGQGSGAGAVLETVLREFDGPVIVDADGINLLAGHKDLLRGRTGTTILTPHAAEFARLGFSAGDRIAAAAGAARDLGCILLLKGHHTVITDGTAVYVNPTGNPGMATGGSGDVLAGMIAGLLGQGIAPVQAAAAAAWLHGRAGDVCAKRIGQYGMLPSDLLQVLPRLMK